MCKLFFLLFLSLFGLLEAANEATCCCGQRINRKYTSETVTWKYNGHWYRFHDCPLTWDEAESYCNREIKRQNKVWKGHLISIKDEDVNRWVKWILDGHYGGDRYGIWIGLKRKECPEPNTDPPIGGKPWKWSDGSRLGKWRNWDEPYQPNCYWYPDEQCVHLVDNFEWNDAECTDRFKFMCKYTKKKDDGPVFVNPGPAPPPPGGVPFDIAGTGGFRRKREIDEDFVDE